MGATHQQVYPITLRVESGDRPGLARDVTTIVAEDKINIVDLRVTTESGAATFFVTVEVTDVNQLVRLIQRIERIKDVSHVGPRYLGHHGNRQWRGSQRAVGPRVDMHTYPQPPP